VRAALGVSSETIELPADCTVRQFLVALTRRHEPRLRGLVVDDRGRLLPAIMLCVNAEQIMALDARNLADGDDVLLMSAISGG
jgi:molybdopterin converting factor small subunit